METQHEDRISWAALFVHVLLVACAITLLFVFSEVTQAAQGRFWTGGSWQDWGDVLLGSLLYAAVLAVGAGMLTFGLSRLPVFSGIYADIGDLRAVSKPVEIHMEQTESADVFPDQHKRRAERVLGHTQACCDTTYEARLTCSELAGQQEDIACAGEGAKALANTRCHSLTRGDACGSNHWEKCLHPPCCAGSGLPLRSSTTMVGEPAEAVISPIMLTGH